MQGFYKKKFLYERFINEKNLKLIKDENILAKYWGYTFSIQLFCLTSGILPTMFGYNFENLFFQSIFGFTVLYILVAILFFILLLKLENKNKLFRNRLLFYLLYSVFFMFWILMVVSAIYTVTFENNADGSFRIKANMLYLFALFIPSYLGYVVFCFYAFMRCFLRYSHTIKGLSLRNKK